MINCSKPGLPVIVTVVPVLLSVIPAPPLKLLNCKVVSDFCANTPVSAPRFAAVTVPALIVELR